MPFVFPILWCLLICVAIFCSIPLMLTSDDIALNINLQLCYLQQQQRWRRRRRWQRLPNDVSFNRHTGHCGVSKCVDLKQVQWRCSTILCFLLYFIAPIISVQCFFFSGFCSVFLLYINLIVVFGKYIYKFFSLRTINTRSKIKGKM